MLKEWGWELLDIEPLYFLLWLAGTNGFPFAGWAMDRWGRRPVAGPVFVGAAVATFRTVVVCDPSRFPHVVVAQELHVRGPIS